MTETATLGGDAMQYRYTIFADHGIPLGHEATLGRAQRMASRMPDARYIIKRLKGYPFTHLSKFPLDRGKA
jgi:hypothetical protein